MKYPRECEIWRACSKKGGMFPNVTLGSDGRLRATDGRILASIEAVLDPRDGDISIRDDALKLARKLAKLKEPAELEVHPTGSVYATNGTGFLPPKGAMCPDPQPIIDKLEDQEPAHAVAFNAKMLYELSRALGGDQIQLEFFDGVIRVRIVGNDARIVPGRLGLIHPVEPR